MKKLALTAALIGSTFAPLTYADNKITADNVVAGVQHFADQAAVKNTLITMVTAVDSNDWATTLAQFDDKVFVDYSSMTGDAGSEVVAKDLVNGWEKLLGKVQSQHLVTNVVVSIDGDTASVKSYVDASHFAKGVEHFDVLGSYDHKLKRTDDGWKITYLKLNLIGVKGNANFFSEVNQ